LSGRKVFTAGEVLQAADVNDYLMDQSVMVFAGTAARGSAIPSPSEGMVTYRSDDDLVEVYNGSAFVPIGTILQVVSTTKTDTFSASVTGNGGTASVTGLTASITPTSTGSKIMVIVNLMGGTNGGTGRHGATGFILKRGATSIAIGDAASNRVRLTANAWTTLSSDGNNSGALGAHFLDSPATTSSITYSVDLVSAQATGATQTFYVNRTANDLNITSISRGVSTITLMEVAG
jgi:hypothetical protein